DVADGEHRIPASAIRRVFSEIRAWAQHEKTSDLRRLTEREREILTLFAQGLSYAKIAEVRGNQPVTVRNAIYGIQDKLGIETKQELVVWAVRKGLLDEWQHGR
ncbi:MAG: response regulator transcription factor, partial [Chloroflexi bacterium]|nr:response regulator transcription factor [Chloroflexota bacterium]